MMRCSVLSILLAVPLLYASPTTYAGDIRGTVGVNGVQYPEAPIFEDQSSSRSHPTTQISINGAMDFTRDTTFYFTLSGRVAPQAEHRYAGDVREADLKIRFDDAEVKAGVLSETWGTLEAWNPVDIINQRDLAEDFQGEIKLGQPGLSVSGQKDDLVWTLLALPYARERRFAEGEDRLRLLPAPILSDQFEGSRWNPSIAMRAQYRLNELDIAVSHFYGHAREPLFHAIVGPQGLEGFEAHYEKISQSGIETQYVIGDSVLKGEFTYQSEGVDSFWGSGAGMETTFHKLLGGFESLTVYLEAYVDGRSERAPITAFQHDIFLGVRYHWNDTADTVFDARFTHDAEWHSNLVDLRASRRIMGDFLVSAQLLLPLDVDLDPALSSLENDKYLKFGLDWYF